METRDDNMSARPSRARGALLRGLGLLLVLAVLACAAAIALSPALRQRVLAVATGRISVSIGSSPSGADVYVDDEPCGTTPTQVRLAPGQRTVRIVLEGHRPWRDTVDPRKTRSVSPSLRPLDLGTLIIASEPSGADVTVDNTHLGTTPVTLRNVEPGAHAVTVGDEPLYGTVTRQVAVGPNETVRVPFRLVSRVEALYRSRIKESPERLSNYTELLRHGLERGKMGMAVATAIEGIQVLERGKPSPPEVAQFHEQLMAACVEHGSRMDAGTREKVLGAVLALFGRLAAARPDEPAAYLPLVHILARAERFPQVVAACTEAARRPGAGGIAHVHIAQACLAHGDAGSAIAILEPATKLRPEDAHIHVSLADACRRAEQLDASLRSYQEAERLSAKAPPEFRGHIQTQIARVLVVKGDMAGALGRYETSLNLAGRPVDLAKGLVAHYPFDKDASDASGKGHHGTSRGATLAAGGKSGSAFSFDGTDDHVAVPAAATREMAAFTIALWLKTTQAKAATRGQFWANPTLAGCATGGWGSGDMGMMLEDGKAAYFHGLTTDNRDMSWFSPTVLNDGKWHHIAFVNAGPLVFLYIDGSLARGEAYRHVGGTSPLGPRSDTASGGAFGAAPLFIGASNASFGRDRAASCYQGLIDDVRIWNRPLTSAEIAAVCGKSQ